MNQNWIARLERKYGKYGIPGLMRYIVIIEIIGAVIGMANPLIYYQFLALDFGAVFRGQIWRLVTFMLFPGISGANVTDMLFFAIEVYFYYIIGTDLERIWGTFRFTLYYVSGIVLSVMAALLVYLFSGSMWFTGLEYINQSLFLAFALIFSNAEILLFFILPIKAKWLGILYAAMTGLNVVQLVMTGTAMGVVYAIAIVVSMLNFIIFFVGSNKSKHSFKQQKRRAQFRKEAATVTPIFRHKCAVCGRTERDDENLEFRFCSKCEGNYEYCSEHIYTHEHVHR